MDAENVQNYVQKLLIFVDGEWEHLSDRSQTMSETRMD